MAATTTTKRPSLAGLDAYSEAFQTLDEDRRTTDTAPRVWAGVAHIGPPIRKG